MTRRNDDKDLEFYRLQAEIAKGLANPVRLRILTLIGHHEVANGLLLQALGISRANLSQHLALLRRVGVVTERREGVRVYYRLTFPEIKDLCASMRRLRRPLRRRLNVGPRPQWRPSARAQQLALPRRDDGSRNPCRRHCLQEGIDHGTS